MKPFRLRVFRGLAPAAAAAALLAAGCATVSGPPPVEISLSDLHFTDATVFETVAVADVRLENLAPEEIRVTGAVHRLAVNGTSLGKGMSGQTVAVPRLGSAPQQVEIHVRNFSLARTLREIAQSRVVQYTLDSTIYVAREGGRDRSVRVTKSGRLDLNQAVATPAR